MQGVGTSNINSSIW